MQPIEVRLSIEANYAGLHPNQRIRGCERFQRTQPRKSFRQDGQAGNAAAGNLMKSEQAFSI